MSTIREMLEAQEAASLHPRAALSRDTRGRDRPDPEDDMRPAFQRDRDRVLHSKSFRRLMGKTQVFLAPRGDHYRNRLTHTLEVAQVGRSIA
ncbi:MAG TPA: deoxyguanosinetriphosphate triphosphohydrolase, partial [Anaeromyxobacteraceae bacterium]|nr:deoxyguanosinetriphosphate triphosphohydrolase [Anaeromyxobacteraceae bacterium]